MKLAVQVTLSACSDRSVSALLSAVPCTRRPAQQGYSVASVLPKAGLYRPQMLPRIRSLVQDKGKSEEFVLPEPLLCGEPGARLQLASSL